MGQTAKSWQRQPPANAPVVASNHRRTTGGGGGHHGSRGPAPRHPFGAGGDYRFLYLGRKGSATTLHSDVFAARGY